MVDADTEVMPDSLNRLVSAFIHDTKIMGLCGETTLSNEKRSWVTMIQVYEYFISHHLAKAFESLFGSVTCLPGCFCMYRVRTPDTHKPLLIRLTNMKRTGTFCWRNILGIITTRFCQDCPQLPARCKFFVWMYG